MRYLFIIDRPFMLPLAAQLEERGHEVFVYDHARLREYDGLLKNRSADPNVVRRAMSDDVDPLVIFDVASGAAGTEEDNRALSIRGQNTKSARSPSLWGPLAKWFLEKKRLNVVGCALQTELFGIDLQRSRQLAGFLKLEVPQAHTLATRGGAISFLEQRGGDRIWRLCEMQRSSGGVIFEEVERGDLLEVLRRDEMPAPWPCSLEAVERGTEWIEQAWVAGGRARLVVHCAHASRAFDGGTGPLTDTAGSMIWSPARPFINWDALLKLDGMKEYEGPIHFELTSTPGRDVCTGIRFGFTPHTLYAMSMLLQGGAAALFQSHRWALDLEEVAAQLWVKSTAERRFLGNIDPERFVPVCITSTERGIERLEGTFGCAVGRGMNPADAFKGALRAVRDARLGADTHMRMDTGELCKTTITSLKSLNRSSR